MIDYSLIWTTRDGREIPLGEMSPEHIKNAVSLLTLWRRDCRARGELDTARELHTTLSTFRREVRRRLKAEVSRPRLGFRR